MRTVFCFVLVFCFLASALLSEEVSVWKLYVKKISVKETKPNKTHWDLGAKKALPPDLFFTVSKENQRKWKQLFKGPVAYDTLEINELFNTQVEVKAGDKVKIDVWDQDLGRHDLVGTYTTTIQAEDLIESQDKTIQFGSVVSFVYFFSEYSSIKEKSVADKEGELNKREAALSQKEKQWEEEKSNWDQERESAREKLAQIQQEWTQEKEKLTQEWNQKEQSYLSEIQKLKDNQPAADSTQEWTQEKEKLTQEWNQKEQSYLSEIQKLKDNPLEKKPKDVVVEERKEIPPLSPEKLEKIHTRLDKAITKMRFGLYREMKSTPYIKECLDIYHGIAGTFLK